MAFLNRFLPSVRNDNTALGMTFFGSFIFIHFSIVGPSTLLGTGEKSCPSIYRREPACFGRNGEMAKGAKLISVGEDR